jgi:micrococcal nuclease
MIKKELPVYKKNTEEKVKELKEYQNFELYQYKAKVIRIVDADTLDAEVDLGFGITMTQRFRIENYDAPETWRPKSEAESIHGKKATERAMELLMGKDILIKSTKVAGVYGRFGATIWLEDGRNFIDVMISEGLEKKKDY